MSQLRSLASPVPAFEVGGDFSLGAEEELMLLDRDGCLTEAGPALTQLTPWPDPSGRFSPEVFTCEIEYGTSVAATAGELVGHLGRGRGRIIAAGHRPLALGLHPLAELGEVRFVHTHRYDAISTELAGLMRTPTAAYQVHVGMPDPAAMVSAFRALRNRLCLFRALAAGSPFWYGRDSGLASARAAIMWSYPRVGVPPVFHSFDEYADAACQQITAAGVPDYTYLWWDLRPQPRLGTIEIRVMDSVPSLELAAGLAALAQGLARDAVERPSSVDLPEAVLRENDFRAVRYGLEARVTDLDGCERPIRAIAQDAVAQARLTLGPDGAADPLDCVSAALAGESECARQRRLASRCGLDALLRDLSRRTASSLERMPEALLA
ncbi:glutamate--cysteine ligase [Nocardioides panacihumi]|uniref:Putative glutamate--cysteine ligase 2 n=1 Tax=Nocardioides panacihumi TaxID=400774 RepID=A0ABN2RFR1_9ACTN